MNLAQNVLQRRKAKNEYKRLFLSDLFKTLTFNSTDICKTSLYINELIKHKKPQKTNYSNAHDTPTTPPSPEFLIGQTETVTDFKHSTCNWGFTHGGIVLMHHAQNEFG